MRILIAAPAPKEREGGVANVVYNTAESLRRLGHEVTCMFNEDILQTPVAFPRFEMVYFACGLVGQLWRRRNEFDVVNIHAPAGFAYGLVRRLRPSSGLPPYVMLLHGIEERRNYAMSREAKKGRAWHFSWKNRIWQYAYHMNLYRWAIVTADYSVVINQETWSVLEVKYRRPVGSVKYIPNGVEPRFFLQREYREDNALRLLFVGTWLDHKGIYYLRDGFEELARRFPDIRLTIAGCRTDVDSVKGWFSAPARDRVDVLPFVGSNEMPGLYAQHDVFVFPSLMEGMPIVLLEAMATGLPVVTTEACGMMDVVKDDYSGLLVRPADTDGFVSAVTRVIESSELRRRLGQAAQEVMKRQTWDHIAARLEKVFALASSNHRTSN